MKVTRQKPRPGETCFGGSGILVPYRPRHDGGTSSPERPSAAALAINNEPVDGLDQEPGETNQPGDKRP